MSDGPRPVDRVGGRIRWFEHVAPGSRQRPSQDSNLTGTDIPDLAILPGTESATTVEPSTGSAYWIWRSARARCGSVSGDDRRQRAHGADTERTAGSGGTFIRSR